MLTITLNLDTGVAQLSSTSTIMGGSQVPVTIVTQSGGVNAPPTATPAFQLALSSQSSSPALLAYLNTFTAQNGYTWTGWLNANDTRLVAYLTGKASIALNVELDFTIAGELQISPLFQVTAQMTTIPGAPTTEGGPVYIALNSDGSIPIGANAKLVPTSNGFKIQVSVDGTNWQDDQTIAAT